MQLWRIILLFSAYLIAKSYIFLVMDNILSCVIMNLSYRLDALWSLPRKMIDKLIDNESIYYRMELKTFTGTTMYCMLVSYLPRPLAFSDLGNQHPRMKSPLEALPVELVGLIVTFLEPCDIASLRLTSRAVENKASQGSFTTLFKHKNVELTSRTLQEMVQMTSQGRLGCLLQHCTITGIVRNGTTATDDEGAEHLRLLTEAFCNLKQYSPKAGLSSLCLRVAARIEGADGKLIEPDSFRSWKTVWDAALRTFNVTMAALNASQLPVGEHLDIFGSLRGCSLGCDAFLAFAQNLKFAASMHIFGSLKRLTVSLSAPHKAATEHGSEETAGAETEAQAESRHSNLILQNIMQVVLPIMPKLESLDLQWYNLRDSSMFTLPVSSTTLQGTGTSSASSTSLKECSLRGIYATESHLLQFLKAVHPTALTLTDTRLVSGTYASIFKYLTSPDSPVTYYHLNDIRERNTLVHFDIPGPAGFRYILNIVWGPSTLTRQTNHVKEEIRYHFAPGWTSRSWERLHWLRSKAHEFGPPNKDTYDLIELNSQKVAAAP